MKSDNINLQNTHISMTSNYIPTLGRMNLLIYFRKNNSLSGKNPKYTTYHNKFYLESTLISSCFEIWKTLFWKQFPQMKGGVQLATFNPKVTKLLIQGSRNIIT